MNSSCLGWGGTEDMGRQNFWQVADKKDTLLNPQSFGGWGKREADTAICMKNGVLVTWGPSFRSLGGNSQNKGIDKAGQGGSKLNPRAEAIARKIRKEERGGELKQKIPRFIVFLKER